MEKTYKFGEIIAPRIWTYHTKIDGGKLESVFHDFFWEPKTVLKAKDFRDSYSYDLYSDCFPSEQIIGFYAWKDWDLAFQYAVDTETYLNFQKIFFIGYVELFGNVYEHERGYRGEYGIINEIKDYWPQLPEHKKLFKRIQKIYNK